jgi:hypothetical protein
MAAKAPSLYHCPCCGTAPACRKESENWMVAHGDLTKTTWVYKLMGIVSYVESEIRTKTQPQWILGNKAADCVVVVSGAVVRSRSGIGLFDHQAIVVQLLPPDPVG